jgi:hypothetical protein
VADKQIKIGLFADDQASAKLERVGQAAENAGGKMRAGSKEAEEYGGHLNAAGEHADGAERNLIGLHDVVDGTATIMAGPGKAGITAYIQGWADLAGGLAPLLPSLAALRLSTIRNTAATIRDTAVTKGAAIGTKAWAAANYVLGGAMRFALGPVGLIIAAVALATAGIIYAYKHSEKFRAIVQASFRAVQAAARALGSGISAVARGIGRAFSGVASAITAPFRFAFNGIRNLWNSTLGGKGFSVPSWVPGIGGKGFTIPYLAQGGIVTKPTLAVLGEAGSEAVVPLDRAGSVLGGGQSQPLIVRFELDGRTVHESLLRVKRGNGGLELGLA